MMTDRPAPDGEVSAVDSAGTRKFYSILYDSEANRPAILSAREPACFYDLLLNQIIDAIVAGREQYDLKPFFHAPLNDLSTITYRHEVMRDLETEVLYESVRTFSTHMESMRYRVSSARQSHYKYQREGLFLEAASRYCEAVRTLYHALGEHMPRSLGLLAFTRYLKDHLASDAFKALTHDIEKLHTDLAAIEYAVLIDGSRVVVRPYRPEPDYTVSVENIFDRFKRDGAENYRVKYPDRISMNHVEANILERVARIHAETFAHLDDFYATHATFRDSAIVDFDREIQFYLAWIDYIGKFKRAGLKFCYPDVSDTNKNIMVEDGFDLALAGKLVPNGEIPVCNNFSLSGNDRILVVTGPNQGGKTTFARMFGQLHYLSSLGCPVPGKVARLLLFDRLFTHFEREEDITTLRGKLEDELIRIHRILEQATPQSILVINEIFSSTTISDALYLATAVMARIRELDALAVCVTFLDELAQGDKVTSMVAGVSPDQPSQRTFKLMRRPADGLAYALSLAEKYGLTFEHIKERLGS